jgi:small subunit ribosomal protein S7
MSRRHAAEKRQVLPDAKFHDKVVTKFMNALMLDGKKSVAEAILYGALDKVCAALKSTDPLQLLMDTLNAVRPAVEVKSRRVGGATYQVPMEVKADRGLALSMRWIIAAARKRSERTMTDRLAAELVDIANSRGAALKKREETHKMADANKAFAHYRW